MNKDCRDGACPVSTNTVVKFRNRFRVESSRLPDWDYGSAGAYFVTICVRDRECLFGDVKEEKVAPSPIGKIVEGRFKAIPKHFQNVGIDDFVVMLNHFHGLIFIKEKKLNITLGVVVGSFKSAVTKDVNRQFPAIGFGWQPRFYDHMVRSEKDMVRVREYIRNNPLQWHLDEENSINFDRVNV